MSESARELSTRQSFQLLVTVDRNTERSTSPVRQRQITSLPPSFIPLDHRESASNSTMAEEPRKRSRFDQAPSEEPPRKSRFDRRSRSPVCKNADTAATARERSPVKSVETPNKDEVKDPAAIAAAAAARITAQLQRQKGIQHVDVPPIRPVSMSIAFAQRRSETTREIKKHSLTHRATRRLPTQPLAHRNLPRPRKKARPSTTKYINRTVTSSKTLRSMTFETATH